jgi:hypothetical protein
MASGISDATARFARRGDRPAQPVGLLPPPMHETVALHCTIEHHRYGRALCSVVEVVCLSAMLSRACGVFMTFLAGGRRAHVQLAPLRRTLHSLCVTAPSSRACARPCAGEGPRQFTTLLPIVPTPPPRGEHTSAASSLHLLACRRGSSPDSVWSTVLLPVARSSEAPRAPPSAAPGYLLCAPPARRVSRTHPQA